MKFICNNCGFSAEIPEKRPNCPMCASSNVTVMSESAVEDKKDGQSSKSEIGESAEEIVPGLSDAPGEKKENVRSEKITLTDNFFDQKPNKEEQEIADVIKELYLDEDKKKKAGVFKLPDWRILAGVGAAVVVLVVGMMFSLFSKDESEDVAKDLVEIEEDVEDEKEEIEKETAEIVKEPLEENVPEDVEEVEEEEVVQQDIEEDVEEVKEEPLKKVAEVEKKAQPVVKIKQKPKKKAIARKKPKSKPAKKTNTTEKYNEFIQLGHAALGQKKYTDALHEYKNAMRLKPRNGKTYKFIGIANAYLQNQTQACKNYRKYIELTPNAKDKAQVQAFLEACP